MQLASQPHFFNSRELALIIILSSMGAVISVPVGYAGNFLKTIPGIPLGIGQILSGVHVLWIILAATLTGRTGAGTLTGVLKGLVEVTLFSYHGPLVLIISTVEGVVVDVALLLFRKNDAKSAYLAGGLSSASNVTVLQFVMMLPFPPAVFAFMYLTSFISGLLFTGYVGKIVLRIVPGTPLALRARAS